MRKPEQNEQIHYVNWLRSQHPKIKTIISPIVKYGGTPKQRAIQGHLQKLMGYETGTLDIFLPIARGCYHGLFIEFKFGKNTLTDEQKEMIVFLTEEGYLTATCYTCDKAVKVTEAYLALKGSK